MSYTNPRHVGRLVLLSQVRDVFASLHVHERPLGAASLVLEGSGSAVVYPGFYPISTDGLKRAENFRSCLATLRRILGL